MSTYVPRGLNGETSGGVGDGAIVHLGEGSNVELYGDSPSLGEPCGNTDTSVQFGTGFMPDLGEPIAQQPNGLIRRLVAGVTSLRSEVGVQYDDDEAKQLDLEPSDSTGDSDFAARYHVEPIVITYTNSPSAQTPDAMRPYNQSDDEPVSEPQGLFAVPKVLPPPTVEQAEENKRLELFRQKLEEQAAEAARAQELIKIGEIKARTVDTIAAKVETELRSVSTFNQADITLPFGSSFASMLVARARAQADRLANLGDIGSLNLFETEAGAQNAGNSLLTRLLAGEVLGTSPAFRMRVQKMIDDRARPISIFRRGEVDSLQGVTNEDAWRIIEDAQVAAARQSSAHAHEDFFYNIRVLEDGTVEHVNPEPENADKPPMVYDFEELVQTLGLPEDAYYNKNLAECGIYVPLEKTERDDPIDLIIERAGGVDSGNIVNVDGFGHGAFVALLTTNRLQRVAPSEEGGFLVFVHHPLVPGYESGVIDGSGEQSQFNIRNSREMPVMAKGGVIEFAVNTWHLTPAGLGWAYERIKEGHLLSFADPREPLREGHKLVVDDIKNRRAVMDAIQARKTAAVNQLNALLRVVSSTSAADLAANPNLLSSHFAELGSILPMHELGSPQLPTKATETTPGF